MTALVVAVALHVLIASHRPATPPTDLSAAAGVARAASPVAWAVDGLAGPFAGLQWTDVDVVSLLLLGTLAALTAAWAGRWSLPLPLAVAVGVGVTCLPHAWSTHGAGSDPLVLLASVATAAVLSRRTTDEPSRDTSTGWRVAAITGGAVFHAPALLWVVLPTLAGARRPTRSHQLAPLGLVVVAALAGAAVALRRVLRAGCDLATQSLTRLAADVAFPAMTASGWSVARLLDLGRALVSEWHWFGLLIACAGAGWRRDVLSRPARRATLATLAAVVILVPFGALDRAVLVPWLTAWWLPWQMRGALVLWRHATGLGRVPGRVALVGALVMLPILNHADRGPGTLANDVPSLTTATLRQVGTHPLGVDDVRLARVALHYGTRVVPATAPAVAACVDRGQEVYLMGDPDRLGVALSRDLTRTGVTRAAPLPPEVTLGDVLADVSTQAVVAFAAAPDAVRWLRPHDEEAAAALGLPPGTGTRREAIAAVGSLPLRAGDLVSTAGAARRAQPAGHGGRPLLPVLVARAEASQAAIGWGPTVTPVVTGELAVVALFDASGHVTLAGTASAIPGLPMRIRAEHPNLHLARAVMLPAGDADALAGPALLPRRRPPPLDDWSAGGLEVRAWHGWHESEPDGDGSFRWSTERAASAGFVLPDAQRLGLRIDAAPATMPGAENRLRVLLNDAAIADDVRGSVDLEVDAALTRPGLNTLTFVVDVVLSAGSVPGDPRALAALVRDVRITRRP